MIRDEATVTITSGPVSGMVTRKRTGGNRVLATRVKAWQVHPQVMVVARQRLREGERLVFLSETEVRTVYR